MATNVAKSTIRNEVLLLSGWSSSGSSLKLTNDEVDDIIEMNHRQILSSFEWHEKYKETVILTYEMTNYTGATVNADSAIITSTDAANFWVGSFVRVFTENDLYQITSVNAGTNATIEAVYQGDDNGSANLSVFPLYYNVSNTALFITDVVSHDGPLHERTRDYLDDVDPGRETEANVPTDFAMIPFTSSTIGQRLIELYPPALTNTPIRVHYVDSPELTNDTDIVPYPSELLTYKTAANVAEAMLGRTSEQGWAQLATLHKANYAAAFREAVRDEIPHLKTRQSMRSRRRYSDQARERPWR